MIEARKSLRASATRLGAQESHGRENEQSIEDQFHGEVNRIDDAEERRNPADEQENDAKENALAGAARAGFVVPRDHLKAGPRIIFAIHPGDGEKVRQLPEEKDGEETPRAGIEPPAGRRPADHGWQRARESRPPGCWSC